MSQYKVSVVIDAQNRANKVLADFQWKLEGMKNKVNDFAERNQDMFVKMSLMGAGVTALFWGIAKGAITSAMKFEEMSTTLTNALWSSSEAQKSLKMINELARKTPFETDKLTASYIKLVNRWMKPTSEELTNLWDLASSQWKDFDMLVEAMLDAQTGEFERLKEFWVRAVQHWDKVSMTFRGVTTEVDKTSEAVTNYLTGLWKTDGVAGAMITQSTTMSGLFSTLASDFNKVWQEIGTAILPYMKELAEWWIKVVAFVWDRVTKNPWLASWIVVAWVAIWWLVTAMGAIWLVLPAIMAGFAVLTWPIGLIALAVTALWIARATNFGGIQEKTKAVIDFIMPYITKAIEFIGTKITTGLEAIKAFWAKWGEDIIGFLKATREIISWIFLTSFANIWIIVSGAFESLKTLAGIFSDLFHGRFSDMREWIKTLFANMGQVVIDVFKNTLDWMRNILDGILTSIMTRVSRAIASIKSMISSVVWGWSAGGWIDGARASGWPVSAGGSYIVGERWPELFVPKSGGSIVPNGGFGWNVSVSINGVSINNGMDLNNFKDIIEATIVKSVRNVQAGIY